MSVSIPYTHDPLPERVDHVMNHHLQHVGDDAEDRYNLLRDALQLLQDSPHPLTIPDLAESLGIPASHARSRIQRLVELTGQWQAQYGFRVVNVCPTRKRQHAFTLEASPAAYEPVEKHQINTLYVPPEPFPTFVSDQVLVDIQGTLQMAGLSAVELMIGAPAHAEELIQTGEWVAGFETKELAALQDFLFFSRYGLARDGRLTKIAVDLPQNNVTQAILHRLSAKTVYSALELGFVLHPMGEGQFSLVFLEPASRARALSGLYGEKPSSVFLEMKRPFDCSDALRALEQAENRGDLTMDESALLKMVIDAQALEDPLEFSFVSTQMGYTTATLTQRLTSLENRRGQLGLHIRQRRDHKIIVQLPSDTAPSPFLPLGERVPHVIDHYFTPINASADRQVNMRRVLEAMQDGRRYSLAQLAELTGIKANTLRGRLLRLQKLTQATPFAYGFVLAEEPILPKERDLFPLIHHTYQLVPTASFVPSKHQAPSLPRDNPTLPITDGIQNRVMRVTLDTAGLANVLITQKPPPNAPALVESSTWVFRPELQELAILRRLLRAAEQGTHGRALRVSEIKSDLKIPPRDRQRFNKMEEHSTRCTLTLLRLGFFVECLPELRGYMGIHFLDPRERLTRLLAMEGEEDPDRLIWLDHVIPFTIKEVKNRIKQSTDASMNERHRLLFRLIAEAQHGGRLMTSKRLCELTGMTQPMVRYAIDNSQLPAQRHDRGVYLRFRTDKTLEVVTLRQDD